MEESSNFSTFLILKTSTTSGVSFKIREVIFHRFLTLLCRSTSGFLEIAKISNNKPFLIRRHCVVGNNGKSAHKM